MFNIVILDLWSMEDGGKYPHTSATTSMIDMV